MFYNTEVLKPNLCDYNNAYISVKCDIAFIGYQATRVAFEHCAPFTKCVTKIDETTINDTEDQDLVMPLYNLIEYSSNYLAATGSFWFYSRDEVTNFNPEFENNNNVKCFE